MAPKQSSKSSTTEAPLPVKGRLCQAVRSTHPLYSANRRYSDGPGRFGPGRSRLFNVGHRLLLRGPGVENNASRGWQDIRGPQPRGTVADYKPTSCLGHIRAAHGRGRSANKHVWATGEVDLSTWPLHPSETLDRFDPHAEEAPPKDPPRAVATTMRGAGAEQRSFDEQGWSRRPFQVGLGAAVPKV
jgi:hypothetical protein